MLAMSDPSSLSPCRASRSACSPPRCGSRGSGGTTSRTQPWQVIGCGLSICVGAVAARVWAGRGAVLLAGAATVGFAIPWGVYAASTDDSGLWGVGW